MIRRYFLFIIFLFLLSGFLTAQEQELKDVVIPRRIKIFMNLPSGLEAPEVLVLKESLVIKLSEVRDILVAEPVEEDGAVSEEERDKKAREALADSWILLEMTEADGMYLITATSRDLVKQETVMDKEVFSASTSLIGLNRSFWRSLVVRLDDLYDSITETQAVEEVTKIIKKEVITYVEKGQVLTIEGLPGMEISIPGVDSVITGEDGRATLELEGNRTYILRGEKEGFYPVKKSFYMGLQERTVTLKPEKTAPFFADVYLENMDYGGAGFGYYFLPDFFYAEIRSTLFMKKLLWPQGQGTIGDYELPLIHIYGLAGIYLTPADEILRLALSTGVFLRPCYLEDRGITLDPLSPFGLNVVSVTAEFSPSFGQHFFLEYSVLAYFSPDGTWMLSAFQEYEDWESMAMGYIFTENMVFDLLNFRLGIRFKF